MTYQRCGCIWPGEAIYEWSKHYDRLNRKNGYAQANLKRKDFKSSVVMYIAVPECESGSYQQISNWVARWALQKKPVNPRRRKTTHQTKGAYTMAFITYMPGQWTDSEGDKILDARLQGLGHPDYPDSPVSVNQWRITNNGIIQTGCCVPMERQLSASSLRWRIGRTCPKGCINVPGAIWTSTFNIRHGALRFTERECTPKLWEMLSNMPLQKGGFGPASPAGGHRCMIRDRRRDTPAYSRNAPVIGFTPDEDYLECDGAEQMANLRSKGELDRPPAASVMASVMTAFRSHGSYDALTQRITPAAKALYDFIMEAIYRREEQCLEVMKEADQQAEAERSLTQKDHIRRKYCVANYDRAVGITPAIDALQPRLIFDILERLPAAMNEFKQGNITFEQLELLIERRLTRIVEGAVDGTPTARPTQSEIIHDGPTPMAGNLPDVVDRKVSANNRHGKPVDINDDRRYDDVDGKVFQRVSTTAKWEQEWTKGQLKGEPAPGRGKIAVDPPGWREAGLEKKDTANLFKAKAAAKPKKKLVAIPSIIPLNTKRPKDLEIDYYEEEDDQRPPGYELGTAHCQKADKLEVWVEPDMHTLDKELTLLAEKATVEANRTMSAQDRIMHTAFNPKECTQQFEPTPEEREDWRCRNLQDSQDIHMVPSGIEPGGKYICLKCRRQFDHAQFSNASSFMYLLRDPKTWNDNGNVLPPRVCANERGGVNRIYSQSGRAHTRQPARSLPRSFCGLSGGRIQVNIYGAQRRANPKLSRRWERLLPQIREDHESPWRQICQLLSRPVRPVRTQRAKVLGSSPSMGTKEVGQATKGRRTGPLPD